MEQRVHMTLSQNPPEKKVVMWNSVGMSGRARLEVKLFLKTPVWSVSFAANRTYHATRQPTHSPAQHLQYLFLRQRCHELIKPKSNFFVQLIFAIDDKHLRATVHVSGAASPLNCSATHTHRSACPPTSTTAHPLLPTHARIHVSTHPPDPPPHELTPSPTHPPLTGSLVQSLTDTNSPAIKPWSFAQ